MSVWCEVSGTVFSSKKISLKKAIKELFINDDVVIDSGSNIEQFTFRFVGDGIEANKKAIRFVDYLKSNKVSYDITVSTRYIN